MTILSLTAVARLAERRVREEGAPVPVAELLAWLGRVDVDQERAAAAVRTAVAAGRLVPAGAVAVRVPATGSAAA